MIKYHSIIKTLRRAAKFSSSEKERLVEQKIGKLRRWPQTSAPLSRLFGWNDGNGKWQYLLENGSTGQSVLLKGDSWNKPDAPLLTVQLNKDGTQGFTIGLEQLISHGTIWLPEQDVFITLADNPVDFKRHLASLKGERILDDVAKQPDASLEVFNKLWSDIGNPLEWNVPGKRSIWEQRVILP